MSQGKANTEFLQFAIHLAREVGDKTAANRSTAQVVSRDLYRGLVTNADQANTVLIKNRIQKHFPSHDILSEERSKIKSIHLQNSQNSKYVWVVDEIDGTNNYSRGIGKEISDSPDWSISIGLRRSDGVGIVGVVYSPDHNALYYASIGNGAFLEKDGKTIPLHVSGSESKDRFVMSFSVNTDPSDLANFMSGMIKAHIVKKLKPRIRESSALELCYVAGGTDDAFLNIKTKDHDVVAGLVIAEEAGAKINWLNTEILLVSNGKIHESLVEIVKNSLK